MLLKNCSAWLIFYRDGAHFLWFSTACLCWARVSSKSWSVRHLAPEEKLTNLEKLNSPFSFLCQQLLFILDFLPTSSHCLYSPLPGGLLRVEQTSCLFPKPTFLSWKPAIQEFLLPFPSRWLCEWVWGSWPTVEGERREPGLSLGSPDTQGKDIP